MKFVKGDVHRIVLNDQEFSENRRSEVFTSLRGINSFLSYYPHCLSDLVQIRYERWYNAVEHLWIL